MLDPFTPVTREARLSYVAHLEGSQVLVEAFAEHLNSISVAVTATVAEDYTVDIDCDSVVLDKVIDAVNDSGHVIGFALVRVYHSALFNGGILRDLELCRS